MARAETDGVIDIGGFPRRVRKGDELPEGATMRPVDAPKKIGQPEAKPEPEPAEKSAKPEPEPAEKSAKSRP
ncbi:MAG TPA: hypothetical protein VH475_22205 [Tepidisphaeraceae bacterium]|jgi:hypothetical protein